MTPEGKVKQRVKRVLAEYNVYQFWPVQMGYGAPTLDCIACHKGHFFAIETKAPGKRPTKRQLTTAAAMRRAGGVVFVIDGTDKDDMKHLMAWLGSSTDASCK